MGQPRGFAVDEGGALDKLVAERVLGMVPCQGWAPVYLGSAGGPAMMKGCAHPTDACYPAATTGGGSGHRAGPAPYSSSLSPAWRVVEAFGDEWTITVSREQEVRAVVTCNGCMRE